MALTGKSGKRKSRTSNFLPDNHLQKLYLAHLFSFHWQEWSLVAISSCKGVWEMQFPRGRLHTQINSITMEHGRTKLRDNQQVLIWALLIPQYCHLSGFRLQVSILGDEVTYWIYVTLHLRNLQIFDVPAFLGELKGQEGSVASEKTKMLNSTLFTIGSFYKIRLNTSMSIKN